MDRKAFAREGETKNRKFRVLFVGADDIQIPSGVFSYVKGLSGNSRSGRFSYTMTASHGNQDDPFLQRIEFPIGYGFSDLLRNASRLSALIRRHEVDLVHLHTVRAGFLGCVAFLFSGTPIVYTGHSWRFLQKDSFLQKSLFYLIEQFICRKANAITFIASDDHAVGKKYRFPINGKSRIVRTRIDKKAFASREEGIRKVRERWGLSVTDFVVGNVSHLGKRKDPRTFLLAASEIAGKVPNSRFLWVGDGELRRETDGWIRELGLEGKAVVSGFVPQSEVPDHLHAMDVFLFTSREEGVPLAMLEAQAVGLPVVSSRYVGSAIEELLVDRHNCLLFEPGDWESRGPAGGPRARRPGAAGRVGRERYPAFPRASRGAGAHDRGVRVHLSRPDRGRTRGRCRLVPTPRRCGSSTCTGSA